MLSESLRGRLARLRRTTACNRGLRAVRLLMKGREKEYRLPFLRRYAAFVREGGIDVVEYYYRLRRGVVIKSVSALKPGAKKRAIRPVRHGPIVVRWHKYLSSSLQLLPLRAGEIVRAIPLRLATQSPFDPAEIAYCIRGVRDHNRVSREYMVSFSQLGQVQEELRAAGACDYYPDSVLSELFLWEKALSQYVRMRGDADVTYLYIRVGGDSGHVASVGDRGGVAPRAVIDSGAGGSRLEPLYDAMVGYLDALQRESPSPRVAGVLVSGQESLVAEFLEKYADVLPAPAEPVSAQELAEVCGVPQVRNRAGREPPPAFAWLLAPVAASGCRIEPATTLQQPFYGRFVRSQLAYLGAFLAALLVVFGVRMGARLYSARKAAAQARAGIVRLEPAFRSLSVVKQEVDRALATSLSGSAFLDALIDVVERKPDDILFTSVNYQRGEHLLIHGYSEASSAPVRFVRQLEESTLFGSVSLRHVLQRRVAGNTRMEFKIEVGLENQ